MIKKPESLVSLLVVRDEIRRAIVAHEIRVAVISGILGLMLLLGTWHAIWLVGIRCK